MEIPTTAVGLGGLALTAVAAVARELWRFALKTREELIQQLSQQLKEAQERNEELAAELKAERLDHLKTLRLSDALARKLELARGDSSNPPPS